ncbi:hypothetical protein J3U75_10240 [Snodgrassella sp. B3088]|uniref:type II restriction enzyme n=1 Tax=Snodgrassella sp. B3088 TaxID=2818038 RepID=UPI002269EFF0|nr:hypothetical protein [Snodgrassella sp. B3088]MCX8749737.1 hypothetical protein [Snodgrassella sp. B3088]
MDKSDKLSISKAWEILFERHDILNKIEKEGFWKIEANQIRTVKEPRLMAKFDHFANLPKIFSDNALSILPITRGSYIIGHFMTYHTIESDVDNVSIQRMYLPEYLQSINSSRITSEAAALSCAYASGIIADFLKEDNIIPSVSGRSGSGSFNFIIDIDKDNTNKCHSIQRIFVSKSQIEIDAGYEGKDSLSLIEAKLDLSDDFLIRQLYYPYRVWKNCICKPIRSIFFVYSNGIYYLYEYIFQNTEYYNSLKLIKFKKYSIESTDISFADIETIMQKTALLDEPKLPFPQADKFERVINICELLVTKDLSFNEITANYAFTGRQTGYYTNAAIYLGLICKYCSLDEIDNSRMITYRLTKKGRSIMSLSYKERQLAFCNLIFQHKVYRLVFEIFLKNNKTLPSKKEIIDIMRISNLYEIDSFNTFKRRSSTVKKWIEWIINLTNKNTL